MTRLIVYIKPQQPKVFLGSYYQPSYRIYRDATNKQVFIVEGSCSLEPDNVRPQDRVLDYSWRFGGIPYIRVPGSYIQHPVRPKNVM